MTKALTPVDNFQQALNMPLVQQQLNNALGDNAKAFAASLIDAYVGGLQKYDPFNVIEEAMKAAILNLPITKSLGFAYLVPYKGKIQFQMGYKGYIQLAMRSGQVKIINAGPVYEGELRHVDKLRGTYDLSGQQISDKVIGYFAYIELINGFEKTIYWTKEHVVKHAEVKSPSYKNKSSAWWSDFDAMAVKTTIRALFSKYAPMTVDFQKAIEFDEQETINITPAKPEKPTTQPGEIKPKSERGDSAKNTQPELVESIEQLREWQDSESFQADCARIPSLTSEVLEHAFEDQTGELAQNILDLLKQL